MTLLMLELCISLPMSSTLIMQTLHFDEVSSDRKLQCLLTDVTISNKIGNKTTVCVKLDTGAFGNL